METVLLTTSAGTSTRVAIKFDEYYLALGSVFADLLSPDWDGSDWTSAVISQKLQKLTFSSMIPSSRGLSRDFQLRRVYLADVHVFESITITLNDELNDVSFQNSASSHSSRWHPELSNTFVLFR